MNGVCFEHLLFFGQAHFVVSDVKALSLGMDALWVYSVVEVAVSVAEIDFCKDCGGVVSVGAASPPRSFNAFSSTAAEAVKRGNESRLGFCDFLCWGLEGVEESGDSGAAEEDATKKTAMPTRRVIGAIHAASPKLEIA